jgi:hypothetical protein
VIFVDALKAESTLFARSWDNPRASNTVLAACARSTILGADA